MYGFQNMNYLIDCFFFVKDNDNIVRFKVLTAINIRSIILWDVMPCILADMYH